MTTANQAKLKIAYVSMSNPLDKKAWSGTHFNMYSALNKHIGQVDIIEPYIPKLPVLFGKILTALSQKINKRYNYRHSKWLSKSFGKYYTKKLKSKKYDLIFAPAASCEIAYLKTNIPIIYISDSTIKSSLNYHKALSNLWKFSENESLTIEKRALEKSSIVAMTSPWAMRSVIEDFNIDKQKTIVLPFGANFEETPDDSFAKNRKLNKTCKLLFVGVNWENKGGTIAHTILTELLKRGIDAELSICGCTPPEKFLHEKIKVFSFLNKNIKSEREQLYKLFEEATFFIFPTRFEAYGIVCCEASAYGLISLAANTGGVSGVVREGENGFLFDKNNQGSAYVEKIIELLNDEKKYKELSLSSRSTFEKYLNWDAWAIALKNKLAEKYTF